MRGFAWGCIAAGVLLAATAFFLRVHPEPAGIGREAPTGSVRLVQAPVVVDPRHQRASGSGSPWNASTGIGTGGAISSRSASA